MAVRAFNNCVLCVEAGSCDFDKAATNEAGDSKIVPGASKARAGCINRARYWMHFGQNIL
jgi:hypothetical protein